MQGNGKSQRKSGVPLTKSFRIKQTMIIASKELSGR
jgi:hypothetical protein